MTRLFALTFLLLSACQSTPEPTPLAGPDLVAAETALQKSIVLYADGWNAKNADRAIEMLIPHAKKGHAPSQMKLAKFYSGVNVNRRQPEKSRYWTTQAANQGLAEAQFLLGINLVHGQAKNPAESLRMLTAAANQGHGKAQMVLGMHYMNKDLKQAVIWLCKAHKRGVRGTKFLLKSLSAEKINCPQ